MQPGGGAQRGSGRGRSSAASPTSSSSAVSTPQQLRLDQQQQQQQQQRQQRELLQQHFAKRPEGNEALHAYQGGNIHGVAGGGNFSGSASAMQFNQQQPRRFNDLSQQNGSSSIREEGGQNRSHGIEQQMLNNQAYLQYAFQAGQVKPAIGMQGQSQQQMMGMFNPSGRDQDIRMGNMKMQDIISMQAANQAQASSRKSTDQFGRGELMADRGKQPVVSGQKADSGPPDDPTIANQVATAKQGIQGLQPQQHFHNTANNSMAMAAQMQAMQALALEHNIDLSVPANVNLIAQLIPMMQSRMIPPQKAHESNTSVQSPSAQQPPRQQASSPQVANESSPHGNTSSDASGQSDSAKARHSVSAATLGGGTPNVSSMNNSSNIPSQQYSLLARENQMHLRPPFGASGNAMPPVPSIQQSNSNLNQGGDNSLITKGSKMNSDALRMQHNQQMSRSSPQPMSSANNGVQGTLPPSQGSSATQSQQSCLGFTKQQLHVLKAQILAFRRIKKGDSSLPRDILQAIAPPPLVTETQQVLQSPRMVNQDNSASKNVEEPKHFETSEKGKQILSEDEETTDLANREAEGVVSFLTPAVNLPIHATGMKEPASTLPLHEAEQHVIGSSSKSEPEDDRDVQNLHTNDDVAADKGKAVVSQVTIPDAMQGKVPLQGNIATQPKDVSSTRKYHGPLFDFPVFTRKHDTLGSSMMVNSNNNFTLAYDIKDIFAEEGTEVAKRKREEKIRKIGDILAVNLERKRIRPDLVVRLQIEEKKLQLADVQTRLRFEIEQQQQDIMAMPERPYRKFVRLCERQRQEFNRQVRASQKAVRDKQLKAIFLWRKKLLEAHWAIRDARTARNRGVAKYHEKMLREFSKRNDDDRNKRMEALKNNDVERYREMLLEQQNSVPGEAAERYAVLSSFLSQTEEYLNRLGSKITTSKNQQEVEEAANAAATAARAQGLSEEDSRAAAVCAKEEVIIRNRFSEMNAPKDGSSVNKYYHLAHAINERVIRQPSMLRAGTLRDYQLVGLQWMLSLYNNKLNGILADEMGLGKTVQVMALIAYLMEFKGNYGPHLIIVPNAVLVNWKSELHTWLPSVSCIYYVGAKDQRARLFSQEVLNMKFNVLVTTYEFIMYDRTKLSKIDWRYIIIDEAQRMKDRESVLARDLDRYRCQRRLLLTGTPLQNDLKELWSLLNLLLPEVFDNRKAFHDWFSQPFQKEGPSHNAEDDWLETEKKVIIIHRLHQILEPFMLRRRVEDVEGSLPPKVSIVLKCRMSAIQSAIYDWVKSTGTIRVDPEDERRRVLKKPHYYQSKAYRTLQNRCMELRKTCNHPLLNYPYFNDLSKDFLVRSCGKLFILDRILVKLHRTGHRVLLFSTMTKLLDLLEEYLQWRRLAYRRIDGTTSLEDRESAIVEFNSPGTDCFIFLLSIRAAGRGLNLQSADTVVIYDPDPNPKNEEQAVARAHRIGQTREVKVIYLEAVVDSISSHQKEDEFQSSGVVDSDDDMVGKDRYMGSIESLIRNNIQQYKIEMADEVINAGRFDQRTTHEERRLTLETLLHDEERYQETVHDVPSLQEVNRMIARSQEEVELFDQMDEELDWTDELTRYDQVPEWLRASTKEVSEIIAKMSKKPPKGALDAVDNSKDNIPSEPEKRRGRPKGKKAPVYTEMDDESGGDLSEASSEGKNGESAPEEEEAEIEETEDEEFDGGGAAGAPSSNKEQSEEDTPLPTHGYGYPRASNSNKQHILKAAEEPASSGSSSDGQRVMMPVVSTSVSQKFGSLSALEARPSSHSKKLSDDLEEGEIGGSGDSHIDVQQSGSWNQDRDEGEDEQVLQPKIKRKRSIRLRPRPVATTERTTEEKFNELPARRVDSLRLPNQASAADRNKRGLQTNNDRGTKSVDLMNSSLKNKRNLNSQKLGANAAPKTGIQSSLRSGRSNSNLSNSDDTTLPHSRDISESKVLNATGTSSSAGSKMMPEGTLKKCKNVISRLQKRIDREGPQIVPLLSGLWKKIESSGGISGKDDNLFDLPEIDMRLDNHEYSGVMQFISDVLLMLRSSMQYYGFSHEVRSEARKVHDLFFDILKILFPDIDFRELKNSLPFGTPSSSAAATTPFGSSSSKQIHLPVQNKHVKNAKEEHELIVNRPQKPHLRGGGSNNEDMMKLRGQSSSSSGGPTTRVLHNQPQESSHTFTHPGELVICKRKRKEREKASSSSSLLKPLPPPPPGNGGGGGPVSPINRVLRSPPVGGLGPPVIKPGYQQQQPQVWQQQNNNNSPSSSSAVNGSGDGNVGWANPVKRLRTGAGKRRPTNL